MFAHVRQERWSGWKLPPTGSCSPACVKSVGRDDAEPGASSAMPRCRFGAATPYGSTPIGRPLRTSWKGCARRTSWPSTLRVVGLGWWHWPPFRDDEGAHCSRGVCFNLGEFKHEYWPSVTDELKGLCITCILGPHSCEWWSRVNGEWNRFELDEGVRYAQG